MNRIYSLIILAAFPLLFFSCTERTAGNEEMAKLLASVAQQVNVPENGFSTGIRLAKYQAVLRDDKTYRDSCRDDFFIGRYYLEMGEEQQCISRLEHLLSVVKPEDAGVRRIISKNLAIAWLRVGERTNCIHGHGEQSCILPIALKGIHSDKAGSQRAIDIYSRLLDEDSSDLESRWLLNIAYMTTGGYPLLVPHKYLINNLGVDTAFQVKPFADIAMNMGLDTKNMAGGSIIEDFNNDGQLDLVTSGWGLTEGMHYCRNNGDGSFTDESGPSGLRQLTGGLNIMQTDYNNDGFKDIFVLRGAWKGRFGKEPNSLIRNNGDGTFTDVTRQSGLLSFHPTQTATWNDFNNDGWLDVFIGNESSDEPNPCELYLNNKNGTFTEVGLSAGCALLAFVKGVTSGDYDNDGLPDLFLSTLDGYKILLKNNGVVDGKLSFQDVSQRSGLSANVTRTFPTWFWDYDNDGWLDILVCGYELNNSLASYAAMEALGRPMNGEGAIFLYRNKHDGTFENVSEQVGLNKIAFAMGSNFGDIDNDGFLDIYLGTGNPQYTSLVPNKMFKNIEGKKFADVTSSARVGNLQKGHGVSFADLDNDGDEDIYIEMGGAYEGDSYQNSLYINPGQNNNHWLNITLQGVTCNKAAIGARIKVSFLENGVTRSVYRDVNSGGSFGSNPLTQHIGVGQARNIEAVEISWPGGKTPQILKGFQLDQSVRITQDKRGFETITKSRLDFTMGNNKAIGCSPQLR